MTVEQKIKVLIAYAHISQAELARRVGMSPANFGQRLKRNGFSNEELEQIAKAVGASYEYHFITKEGAVI